MDADMNIVETALRKMTQPLRTESKSSIEQLLDNLRITTRHCLQTGQEHVDGLLDVKNIAEHVKTIGSFNNRLEEFQKAKYENDINKARTTEKLNGLRAEEDDLKKQLRATQRDCEKQLKIVEKRLESERAAFSAYLLLCGHVRLGTAVEAGDELRGCVSVQPSDQVTFSLDTAALPAVRLTNRLWTLAAEGVADGTPGGAADGTPEGVADGTPEGAADGTPEGVADGTSEGAADGGEKSADGAADPGSKPAEGAADTGSKPAEGAADSGGKPAEKQPRAPDREVNGEGEAARDGEEHIDNERRSVAQSVEARSLKR
ncbi:uncharacterized protein LOC122367507 [Amphibalanus amphitrite]|uniref:uncharacterized protein LOC122367507 n=1 Tax=Amphibalanus amphitrite TaxID=1232801 RepID=UPI001C912F93|nr:uncharacterized protein LOC122367507 [Amphibalanus amphitrite]XP_043196555.1 uncharacterized protein LOC122367507 [Amphibalanus amphitrite]XP_043196556.1 uncharacterized protein LOC122367507 [Amphibalanus amphitrite]XP_043196557.1 uncharacterized protein LOC122367507 [Amphibalanus amphitrite]